jgi:hypothetical protein
MDGNRRPKQGWMKMKFRIGLLGFFLFMTWGGMKALAQERGLPIPVLPDSASWIFRSTHIVRVTVLACKPHQETPGQSHMPRVDLDLSLLEIIKGNVTGLPSDPVHEIYIHYPPDAPTLSRLAGAWSYLDISPGKEYYLFCELSELDRPLAKIISDSHCKQVMEATPYFVKNMEFIKKLETKPGSELDTLGQAGKIAGDLDGFFFAYLLANPSFHGLKDHEVFEALMTMLENPTLARNSRSFLESELCSLFEMQEPEDAWFAQRFAVSLFRVLDLEQADVPNTVGTYLPNHLGLEGGGHKLKAKDVFKQYPADRARAVKACKQLEQDKYSAALVHWLGR